MKEFFTTLELKDLNALITQRFRARMGMDQIVVTRLISRRDGLTVSEGMCPHCRKEMVKMPKIQNMIVWRCEGCDIKYRVVDPKDEINRLTGGAGANR